MGWRLLAQSVVRSRRRFLSAWKGNMIKLDPVNARGFRFLLKRTSYYHC
jgi:hypothetical protein